MTYYGLLRLVVCQRSVSCPSDGQLQLLVQEVVISKLDSIVFSVNAAKKTGSGCSDITCFLLLRKNKKMPATKNNLLSRCLENETLQFFLLQSEMFSFLPARFPRFSAQKGVNFISFRNTAFNVLQK